MFSARCGIAVCWQLIFVYNISSIAREPKLDEWVARATIFDGLQDTVSIFSPVCLLLSDFFNLSFMLLIVMIQVRIAMVGKYTGLSDSYLSVLKVNFSACSIQ